MQSVNIKQEINLAKETAKFLFDSGLSIMEYEKLQEQRKRRLNLWLDKRIKVIAEIEMRLINEGEMILFELKKLYEERTKGSR